MPFGRSSNIVSEICTIILKIRHESDNYRMVEVISIAYSRHIVSTALFCRGLLCSMDVQCVYFSIVFIRLVLILRNQPKRNLQRIDVLRVCLLWLVNNKMDTMDIYCVHWTCPLATKVKTLCLIDDVCQKLTFSTVWYMSNGRPLDYVMDMVIEHNLTNLHDGPLQPF
jgi:hypothetical protein